MKIKSQKILYEVITLRVLGSTFRIRSYKKAQRRFGFVVVTPDVKPAQQQEEFPQEQNKLEPRNSKAFQAFLASVVEREEVYRRLADS
jgi:Flp pilus assembly secretin CpaC